jgi:hypothetical protein
MTSAKTFFSHVSGPNHGIVNGEVRKVEEGGGWWEIMGKTEERENRNGPDKEYLIHGQEG